MVRSILDATKDAFLGGRLDIWQPRLGYRAGVDPVLLAASVPAKPGQTVLELGCGVGVAALCLATRVDGLTLTGVEMQADYADLARRNAIENDLPFDVITADLRQLPTGLRQQRFDHVIMNPPYFDQSKGSGSNDGGRNIALRGETNLSDWIDIGTRRLAPKGYLTLIQRMERLPETLSSLTGRLGSLTVRPIAGRSGKAPDRFLLQARQGGRASFRMTAPLIMHEGAAHLTDSESYRSDVADSLRNGAALPFPA
ncbi:tRNA1(Val) (adenine(37)-N6)-methyltransferase [Yoonia sp. 2307UL14-13]|uniref:tRNA1(Val) (adenine(37)-N6)-methyltransferase n=1 Tax=Yoonia sp. 2307UL14-13 TaxID=3126506 RepID=UPI0030A776DA